MVSLPVQAVKCEAAVILDKQPFLSNANFPLSVISGLEACLSLLRAKGNYDIGSEP